MKNPKSIKYLLAKSNDITDPDPRKQASKDTMDQLTDPSEYKFARKSKIKNQGEDIAGAARHIRGQWKGLEAAEKEGTAESLINSKNLQKFDPVDLMPKPGHYDGDHYTALLYAKTILNKFPAQPEKVPATAHTATRSVDENGKTQYTVHSHLQKVARAHYVKGYQKLKGAIENQLSGGKLSSGSKMLEAAKKAILDHVMSVRNDQSIPMDVKHAIGNHFVDYVNKYLANRRLKVNVHANVAEFLHHLLLNNPALDKKSLSDPKPMTPFKVGDDKTLESILLGEPQPPAPKHDKFIFADELAYHMHEPLMKYLEGQTLPKIFPGAKKETRRFDHADLYGTSILRSGPEMPDNFEEHQKALMNDIKLRGLQYGNSVTDSEREHHVKHASMALHDLTRALGLPKEMGSFNGRLGLAIGARGKSAALAHYEPGLMTINLTRKNGTGSLAHEWGHFFDHILNKVSNHKHGDGFASNNMNRLFDSGKRYYDESEYTDLPSVYEPMNNIMQILSKDVANRMRKDYRSDERNYKSIAPERFGNYWLSDHEMFARAFEGYLHKKLQDRGEHNHYLTKSPNHFLWPTNEEISTLSPHFDKLFDNFKASKYLKKSMNMLRDHYHVRFGNGVKPKNEAPNYTEWELSKDDLWKILENFNNHRWFKETTNPLPADIPDDPKKSIFDLNYMNRSQAEEWLQSLYDGMPDNGQKVTFYTHKFSEDRLPGGKGDSLSSGDIDPIEYAMGQKTESEHTTDPQLAAEISRDHLAENPHYYSKLKDAGLADELEKGYNQYIKGAHPLLLEGWRKDIEKT